MKETAGIIFTIFGFCALLVWAQFFLQFQIENNVCFTVLNTEMTLSVFLAALVYEVVSFTLYYRPLRETSGISTKHIRRCSNLLSADKHTPDGAVVTQHTSRSTYLLPTDDPGAGETVIEKGSSMSKSFHSLSVLSHPSLKKKKLTFNISERHLDLLEEFKKIVQRNFWAGIITMFTCWSMYTLFLLFHCAGSVSRALDISSAVRASYWTCGVGEICDKTLGVIVYLGMMLCDNNWRRALIPFFFWKIEEWDV